MNIQSITTDANAASAGKWFDFEDAQFLIAAHMNPAHKRVLQRLGKMHAAALRRNDVETSERITIEATAEAVLLDWKNVESNGTPYPATLPNRLALLQNSAPLREFVAQCAMEHANFLVKEESAAVAEIKSGAPVADQVGG